MPTKENHNGDKHATITKLVIFIANIVRNYSWAHYSRFGIRLFVFAWFDQTLLKETENERKISELAVRPPTYLSGAVILKGAFLDISCH